MKKLPVLGPTAAPESAGPADVMAAGPPAVEFDLAADRRLGRPGLGWRSEPLEQIVARRQELAAPAPAAERHGSEQK